MFLPLAGRDINGQPHQLTTNDSTCDVLINNQSWKLVWGFPIILKVLAIIVVPMTIDTFSLVQVSDDYKKMMGQHWSDIEENIQGTKDKTGTSSPKKRHTSRSLSKTQGHVRRAVNDGQDDIIDSLKPSKNPDSISKVKSDK